MAPPKPTPKAPREDLAKALAAASQWHFSTKNLSVSNRKDAERNYLYVKKRIRETGGDLSPAEKGLAKTYRAERASRPPPRPVLGDVSDRSTAARKANLARGAAKTGGMGQAERTRAYRALTAPEKKRGDAILKELKQQGFPEPKTEAQAQAQYKQLLKSFNASESAALKEARKHPLRVGWNAPLIGREAAEQMAIVNAQNMAARDRRPPPPPGGIVPTWTGKVGDFLDYITPEVADRPAAFAGKQAARAGWTLAPDALDPLLKPAVKDIKGLTADAAMAVPAITETIYNDLVGHTKGGAGTRNLAKQMAVGFAHDLERTVPFAIQTREAYAALLRGDTGEYVRLSREDLKRAGKQWGEKPVTSLITVAPVATAAARIATFPSIVRNIARANEGMSKTQVLRAARKESYVPGYGAAKLARTGGKKGWKGGIPPRILKGEIKDPETGEILGAGFETPARPPSRSALGRGLQNAYDNWSRSEGTFAPGKGFAIGKVTGRFSELHRASRNLERRNKLTHEASRAKLLQQTAVIERYIRMSGLSDKAKNIWLPRLAENRARLAETFYGPQGPSGVDPDIMLKAVAEDLRSIAEEGGYKGGKTTNALLKINKEIQRIDLRQERLGGAVDLQQGLWAQATNVMRKAGYSQAQIEVYHALMVPIAQAWAKREKGRDPNDWLESPEGRNIAGFEFGTPDANSESLFQQVFPGEQTTRIPSADEFRATAYDGVDLSVFREHNIDEFLEKIPEYLERGAPYRHWYENSGREILDFANGDKDLAARIAQVVAVMSASRNPRENINLALQAVRQFQDGKPITVTTAPQNAKAESIMRGEPWEGRKTNRFYANMLEDIDEARYKAEFPEGGEVTNDIWMARLFGLKSDVPTKAEYDAMTRIQQNIAAVTGWKPKQIQAALWVPAKADAGRMVTGKGGVKERVPLSDDEAGIDFARALQEESATIGVEAAPGFRAPGQALLRAYDDLDWEDKRGYTSEKADAVREFLRESEIFGRVEVEGLGIFEDATNPNFTITIPTGVSRLDTGRVSKKTGEPIKTPVSWTGEAEKRHLNQVMSIIGDAFNQDAMAWFRPIYRRDKPQAQNGMLLKLSRSLTHDEQFLLHQELKKRLGGDVPVVPAPGGLYTLNFSGAKNVAFHDEVERIIGEIHEAGDPITPELVPFRFDGDYRTRSRYSKAPVSPSAAAARTGRPDVQRAAHRLRERSEEIDTRYLGSPERVRTPEPARVLAQATPEGVIRGAVEFLDTDDGRQLIYLSEHADASTFAHELIGHAAHEMKREMPDEFAAIEKRYKKPLEDWTEVEHEKFAREAERYLMGGKAPTPELEPVFRSMKRWMYTVYETIRALGRTTPKDTTRLLDRYFGKEPISFDPPARVRRTGKNAFPSPTDEAGVGQLVDDTADLILRGPDVLRADPAARRQIAGSMAWLEQQVLPFLGDKDPKLADRVHELFGDFDEVKSGSSIFSPDERRLLEARGKLLGKRHAQMRKMEESLGAQPDRVFLDEARRVMDELDEADNLEDVAEIVKDLKEVVQEGGKRTQFDYESQRLLSRQVKDLERALDPDRKVNKTQRDEAMLVMREISAQMSGWYLDVFGEGLGPEARAMLKRSLEVRDNIIPTRLRELGLLDEGTGEGVYVPHFSVFDKLFSRVRGPVRLPAAGANRKILSTEVRNTEAFQRGANKLRRYGTGTAQVDPRALLSAYKNRFRFLETANLRRQLYSIGVEIPKRADGNPRIPEGWYIINGTGEAIPERLKRLATMSEKEIDEMLASGEDFDSKLVDESGTLDMLEEYKKSWLAKGESKIPGDWSSDNLRMLPPEVVETLVGKVFESTPGGFMQSVGGLLSVGGRVATIFSHPMGYIHANVAANAVLLALTNPARAPRAAMEFFRLPVSLRAKHPHLYEDITVQTGDVASEAGLPSFYVKEQTGMERAERAATRGAQRWASVLGNISDQPFRVASWTGHARKYGYNTPEQWRELIDSKDPEVAQVRDIIAQRTREDMLDFNKLTPQEQRMARYLFIWPFIRAATAQPLWMLREYPGRIAAMTQVADAQERAYKEMGLESVKSKYNAIAPAEERSMFDIGEVPVGGGSLNMGPVNPLGPAAEKFVAGAGLLQNPKDLRAVGELINPAYASLGEGIFGREMDWTGAGKNIIPLYSYYKAFREPKHRGAQKYTDRDSFWDYIRRRELRFFPEDVDAEKVRESGKKENERTDTRPTWEKSQEADLKTVDDVVAALKKKGKPGPNPKQLAAIKRSITAYNAFDSSEKEWEDKLGKTDLSMWDKVRAAYDVVEQYYPELMPKLPRLGAVEDWPDTATKGPNKTKLRQDIRDYVQRGRSAVRSSGRKLKVDVP